ncbi:hypothetical protein GA0116948_11278 [Chitinophaga costaii]|uniref:Uncharacterized protein n=1 Tax=Chitinophaga costaii TaxID=1335309 RepID=A0A1C4F7S9_9BACT|nr:hypothetical protein [Chitinophaga costaii]PUZ21213.1 hypothetical protein DCM91_16865 [Chitinophaga costaii]SCC51894.1 hypothetical protein GA0116948_11278 [Chitinophaga costaii]
MHNIIIAEQRDQVVLIDVQDVFEQVFQIPVKALANIKKVDQRLVSAWIYELRNKRWATVPFLYDLATAIQIKVPDNQIDWKHTFYIIENDDYHQQVATLKALFSTFPQEKPDEDKVAYFKKEQRQTRYHDVEMAILQIVRNNLEDHALPYRGSWT